MSARYAPLVLTTLVLAATPVEARPEAPLPPPQQIGPFRVGMTIDEALAAGPALTWTERRSDFTDRVLSISAPNALTIGDVPHGIDLEPGYYGSYVIVATSDTPAEKERECRERFIGILTDLEQRFGMFDAPSRISPPPRRLVSAPSVQYSRTPEGYGVVTGVPGAYAPLPTTKPFGVASHFEIEDLSWRDDGAWFSTTWVKPTRDDVRTIDVAGGHETWSEGRRCTSRIEVSYVPPRPAFEEIDKSKLREASAPSLSARHYSLVGVELPADHLTLDLECRVNRVDGSIEACLPKNLPPEYNPLPLWAAIAVRTKGIFVEGALDPDNPVPLLVKHVPLEIDRAERLTLDATNAELVGFGAIRWASGPAKEIIESSYPRSALALRRSATVTASCQIQRDLSLVCADVSVNPPEFTEFASVPHELAPMYRAEPELVSGAPAAGVWTRFVIEFRPAEE